MGDWNEILKNLKADILDGVPVAEALADAAEESGFSETALRVRFEKAFDRTPEEMSKVKVTKIDRVAEALEAAARRWEHPDVVRSRPQFGKLVTIDGEKFRYVAHDGRKAMLVGEETAHIYTYTGLSSVFRKLAALEKLGL